jgi:hypothetical protein
MRIVPRASEPRRVFEDRSGEMNARTDQAILLDQRTKPPQLRGITAHIPHRRDSQRDEQRQHSFAESREMDVRIP